MKPKIDAINEQTCAIGRKFEEDEIKLSWIFPGIILIGIILIIIFFYIVYVIG